MTKNCYINEIEYPVAHPFRKEAERILASFDTDTYINDGVIRWKTNNRVPPQDILEFWQHMGKKFSLEKSVSVSAKETDIFLDNYRKNQRDPSEEELFEMRAAFGEGTEVVDIITGRKIAL